MGNLDSDLLRSFIAVTDAGSVTDGAAQIHRSQSAVSNQIKRLESLLGCALFERHGRGVYLTDSGRQLIGVARDVITRLDAVHRDLSADALRGQIRLGVPDDHNHWRLAQIVGEFAHLHPEVELEVSCTLSTGFPEDLEKGRLDLAVYEVENPAPGERLLLTEDTCWAASAYRDLLKINPLPVALFDHACWWRDAALNSLQTSERPYRIVYTSQSVAGISAAVEAGIAVGLLRQSSIHSGMVVIGEEGGFGPTPTSKLVVSMTSQQASDIQSAMQSTICSAFKE